MRPIRIPAAGAVLIMALGAVAAPAQAASETYRDARRDVMRFVGELDTFDPDARDPDIVRTTNRHTRRHVMTTVTVREVSDLGRRVVMRVRTPQGNYSVRGTDGGRFRHRVSISAPPGRKATCSNGRFSVDPAKRTMTLKVPRRCLDNPRWVSLAVGVTVEVSDSAHLVDDSRASNPYPNVQLRFGPRLGRG